MKAERDEEIAEENFEASRGWFMTFKKSTSKSNVQMLQTFG